MKLQAIISLFLEEINQQQQRISYITLQHGQMYFEMIRNMYTLFFFQWSGGQAWLYMGSPLWNLLKQIPSQ